MCWPSGFEEAAGPGTYHVFAGPGDALEDYKKRPGRLGENQACLCVNRKGFFYLFVLRRGGRCVGSRE